MCSSQASLRARIHRTISKLCHFGDVSWCGVLPVITLIICALAPLSFLTASVLSFHASDPYTMMLHTLDLYRRSRRLIVLGSTLNRGTNFYQNRHFLRQNGLKFDFGPASTNES